MFMKVKMMTNKESESRLVLRLPQITKNQLETIAKKKDLTVSQIVRKLIREYVEKNYEQELFD